MSAPDPDLSAKAAALEGEILREGEGPAAGQEEEPARNGPTSGEILTSLLRVTFDIMAPAWRVPDSECAFLGEAYGALADKYFPNFDLGVELAALLATAAVFGPRMKTPMREPKEPPAETAPADEPTPWAP